MTGGRRLSKAEEAVLGSLESDPEYLRLTTRRERERYAEMMLRQARGRDARQARGSNGGMSQDPVTPSGARDAARARREKAKAGRKAAKEAAKEERRADREMAREKRSRAARIRSERGGKRGGKSGGGR